MRSFGVLLLALVLSGLVGGAVRLQLGVYFNADLELVGAMMVLAAMTLVTTFALGVALALARRAATIDMTAAALVGLVMLALALLVPVAGLVRQDVAILSEIFVPVAIMIAIQWWLVRRRWRRANMAASPA